MKVHKQFEVLQLCSNLDFWSQGYFP